MQRPVWLRFAIHATLSTWLSAGLILAQDSPPSRPQYVHESWQTEQGLPQNTVTAILQTRDGYLWLGTFGGLARFDGLRFTIFDSANTPGFRSNRILSLYEDHGGNLWIGTEDAGVARFRDGAAVSFTSREGLPSDFVRSIQEDRHGGLWVNTSSGVARLEGERFVAYRVHQGRAVQEFRLEAKDGSTWFFTRDSVTRFSDQQPWDFPIPGGPGLVTHESRDGSIWIDTTESFVRFQKGSVSTILRHHGSFAATQRFAQDKVLAMAEGPQDTWLLTPAGLRRFRDGKLLGPQALSALQHADQPQQVRSFLVDREGNFWVGTDGAGLYRFREAPLAAYGKQEGLSDGSFTVITQDREGSIWVGGEGLYRFDGRQFSKMPSLAGVRAIHQTSDRDQWFGGYGGLYRWSAGKLTAFSGKEYGTVVTALLDDEQGGLWVGFGRDAGRGGLYHFRAGKFEKQPGLRFDDIHFLTKDRRGNLWIGSTEGLARFSHGSFTYYSKEQGLSNDSVRAVEEDADGTYWVATYGGGLNRFKDGRFTPITTRDGLPDNMLSRILEDEAGNFWISSNRGIFRVSRKELNDVADGRLASVNPITYGTADGMRTSECNGGGQPAGWRARDGRFWFPTIRGVVAIDPGRVNPLPPPVVIEGGRAGKTLLDARTETVAPPGAATWSSVSRR
jgi:ligand-binding sensor domain-containing protein